MSEIPPPPVLKKENTRKEKKQYVKLFCVPLELKIANALVDRWHRHHRSNWSHKFAIGIVDDQGVLHGAAICAKPVARNAPQYTTIEVARLVSDGTVNACSKLYAACANAAKAMGYHKIQTYILEEEPGSSLKAAGWKKSHDVPGRKWDNPKRRRNDYHPTGPKTCWVKELNPFFDLEQIDYEQIKKETLAPDQEELEGWV